MAVSKRRRIVDVAVLGILLLMIAYLALPNYSDSISKMSELALEDDLYTLRGFISDYTADQNRRPESLQDLVSAGYVELLPKDPMTMRRDSWVTEVSKDPARPGIVGVRSGSSAVSSKGTKYSDW